MVTCSFVVTSPERRHTFRTTFEIAIRDSEALRTTPTNMQLCRSRPLWHHHFRQRCVLPASGYADNRLIGKQSPNRQPGTILPNLAPVWRTISSGKSWRGEICNRSEPVNSIGRHNHYAFLDQQGRIERYVSIRTDITDRKEAEIALQQSQRILLQAQDTARIGSYSYDIVHDVWQCLSTLNEIFGIDVDAP